MLDLQNWLIKERVGFMKMVDVFDILDPQTQQTVGIAKEEPGSFVTVCRWVLSKKLLPTKVEIRKVPGDELVFTISKPVSFWQTQVDVLDATGKRLGYFKSKVLSFSAGFWVYDDKDNLFAEIKGKWHGWDFKFLTPDGVELGSVAKKWAGLAKELFTSADNYVVSVAPQLANQPIAKMLLLGAALAIDVVYYEQG